MDVKTIVKNYPPHRVESQQEFDRYMALLNEEQGLCNRPLIDKERELNKQKSLIMSQKQALNVQLEVIHVQYVSVEQERAEINRVFHDLKHQMIMMNPKDGYGKLTGDS